MGHDACGKLHQARQRIRSLQVKPCTKVGKVNQIDSFDGRRTRGLAGHLLAPASVVAVSNHQYLPVRGDRSGLGGSKTLLNSSFCL
ncbi:TPA: hypothetical protein ACKFMW_001073 [Enterobacter hormaechei]|uniref:hypothetical protein n=1 Tax=Enterobacter TaxID=547 RepID=UPI0012B8EB7A|nr:MULTISPECIES: hypothetical protein [Enterobacter cloacae complex]EKU3236041.1 hypothetical protein [Enterobacter hormaechei]ELC6430256.1 hypothetical protein [Enterobacter hormaechei]ELS4595937.1 hypothetical protein [Enterobacter hormaechei]ELY2061647.1 hypothetical protein [Enterobacter hormaechei]ELY2066748.1 hypothetical protein [Enterobacter hormaechei]